MSLSDPPWTKEYRVLGIRKTLSPYPAKPVYAILEEVAEKYKKNGFIQNNFKISYVDVLEHVNRLATAFHKLGLQKGDRVATLLPTSIQFAVVDYAISKAGLVQLPTSALEPVSALKHKFTQGTPRALVCLEDYLEQATYAAKNAGVDHVIVTRIEDYAHNTAHLSKSSSGKYLRLMDLIRNNAPAPPDQSIDVEKDLETLLFTGGTTGFPKGCMLTHRNIFANALQNYYAMGHFCPLLRGAISVLVGLPFFHSFGHVILHTMTMLGCNQILINDPRDTRTMIQMIKDYKPMIQIGVPTQFMNLCEAEIQNAGMLGLSGSAPLPPSAQEAYEIKARSGIMEGYGLSEMSPSTHLNTTFLLRLFGGKIPSTIFQIFFKIPGMIAFFNKLLRIAGPKNVGSAVTWMLIFLTRVTERNKAAQRPKPGIEKRGTIGIPMPDTNIMVLDTFCGEEIPWDKLAAGMQGEMVLRGPQRMLGYWPTPGQGLDKNGYIHTGDVVKVDDRGYFYIVDRTKDMITVSGYKVYSREIDDILFDHDAVSMAATIGIPDPVREGSEIVISYIQLKEKYKNQIDENQFISYLRERVARYAVPKKVFYIDEIPLTEVQKTNKKLLKQKAIEDCQTIFRKRAAMN